MADLTELRERKHGMTAQVQRLKPRCVYGHGRVCVALYDIGQAFVFIRYFPGDDTREPEVGVVDGDAVADLLLGDAES